MKQHFRTDAPLVACGVAGKQLGTQDRQSVTCKACMHTLAFRNPDQAPTPPEPPWHAHVWHYERKKRARTATRTCANCGQVQVMKREPATYRLVGRYRSDPETIKVWRWGEWRVTKPAQYGFPMTGQIPPTEAKA